MVLIIILSSVVLFIFFFKATPEMHMQLYFRFAYITNVSFECADCV